MKSKNVLLIIPSLIIAKGIESILADVGEFEVSGIFTDLSPSNTSRIKNLDPDVVVIDPTAVDFASRSRIRSLVSGYTSASLVAFSGAQLDEDTEKQFTSVIGYYDSPASIVKKLRGAVDSAADAPKPEGEELSAREKEILVCVAKGMLNKEIAYKYNISIYTVITHRKNITRKTGIKSVAGLTVYALLNNLIDAGSVE